MPGRVRVKLLAARNLPIMDRASEACDAFGEVKNSQSDKKVKLGSTCHKTEICRKSLNPQWNSDWFRFEVEDEEDEPLQIRIMDYDTYSANDAIGKVYIGLSPMLSRDVMFSGWLPIYDTMHGIRGEVNVAVELSTDRSCGVRFFYSSSIPEGYTATSILGFVEELVVNDDPEYKWIDKIRTPRASNEARQTLFSKLSGKVQRHIAHKTQELGGNAVLGYMQCFDLEGESGVVVRGIGTAAILVPADQDARKCLEEQPSNSPPQQSDLSRGVVAGSKTASRIDILEYPFLTIRELPAGFIYKIVGMVSARSVKLLDQVSNPDEPETRDAWWTEVRKEIRSHARSLSCNVVLGYTEVTNICEDVMVLSASGTAVLLGDGATTSCDILFATIEPPSDVPILGKGTLIQARVCRQKKDLKGEHNAREICDGLPFLELNLHRQMRSKLKMKNMNAIFGLKVQVAVGERIMTAIATGTGVFLSSPWWESDAALRGDEYEDEEDGGMLQLPEGLALCSTQLAPGVGELLCNLQLFLQTYRAKLLVGSHPTRILARHFDHILQSLFVKLRHLVPCCLLNLSFHVELPDQDDLQVTVVGTAVSARDWRPTEQDLIFDMDEEPTCQRTQKLHGIDLTSLSTVPGARIEKYLGNVDFFLIREETREEGGLSGVVHSLMTEVLAIARAHVASLGGNAIVAFRVTHWILHHSLHKNQGQCLVSVAGDAVRLCYSS
ncbi:C2 domain-containing protein 5-like isoform X3 [Ornithodoros turicata]|uniref:C2 domain-containing protein 5-like isoform X3 n=1 Tax=Ornithodoros turicata TaxID=34597 RepID=UPI003138C5A7